MDLLYPLSGFVVGAIVGLTGVGGGSLMTPVLVMLFGFAPATAVGTDLLYASLTKGVGAALHWRRGNVDHRTVMRLLLGSLPAAAITLAVVHALATDSAVVNAVLSASLGVALVATAAALLLSDRLRSHAATAPRSPTPNPRWTIAVGMGLGILVTLSSVGAGALGTVALLLLVPAMRTSRVVGTDIAHAVPLTLVAGLGHAALGHVDWKLLGSLLIGSVPGIWLGSAGASLLPERFVRSALASLLTIVGVRLMF